MMGSPLAPTVLCAAAEAAEKSRTSVTAQKPQCCLHDVKLDLRRFTMTLHLHVVLHGVRQIYLPTNTGTCLRFIVQALESRPVAGRVPGSQRRGLQLKMLIGTLIY